MPTLTPVIGALAIFEDDNLLGTILVNDCHLDRSALDQWLSDDCFVPIAHQKYIVDYQALVNLIGKPFHVEELMARADALLRRVGGWAQSELTCGPVTLNTRSQAVTVEGKAIELTSFEYRLLEYLMLHAGELVSKADLTEHIYQQDFDRDSNVLEVFIGRLRRKLDPDNVIKPIETVRGRGYRFALERSDSPEENDSAASA